MFLRQNAAAIINSYYPLAISIHQVQSFSYAWIMEDNTKIISPLILH